VDRLSIPDEYGRQHWTPDPEFLLEFIEMEESRRDYEIVEKTFPSLFHTYGGNKEGVQGTPLGS
jgi:hypothetical protein